MTAAPQFKTRIDAIRGLIANLNEAFADLDAKHALRVQEWARGRCDALREYRDSEEGKALSKKGAWGGIYDKLWAIAGGKTWYKIFSHGYSDLVREFMDKNSEAVVEKRNALIARKLEIAGVAEVLSRTYTRTNDGFNGEFRVRTDSGEKSVIVDTVYAGGHSIQCWHTRTLVKIK